MRNKSILLATGLYPPDIGGPATYCQVLNRELPRRGFSVGALSFGSVRHLPKILRHLVYLLKVWRQIPRYEIIYAQDPVSVGLPVCLATILRRRPFQLKIVGDYAWEQGSQRFGVSDFLDDFSVEFKKYSWPVKFLKLIQTFVAKRAEKIIVPSNYLKKIVSNWGVDPGKIKVIYNAFGSISLVETKEKLRQSLGLNSTTLLSVGRLVPWKGFDLLIDLMPELIKKVDDLRLVIIGSGPEFSRLQKKINDLNLTDHISLTDQLPREEVLRYVKASDIFLLNTAYEGLSHQLLEVMWCETPIITTDIGGNPELITDRTSGRLLPYNDSSAWLEAIKELLANGELGREFASFAKAKVDSFNEEVMISRLEKEWQ